MPPGDPHSGVELRHLRYLVAVVEAGTFTQAAERIDPPSRHSLAVALAFAATASRPTAVLSSPVWAAGDEATGDVRQHAGDAYDMVRVRLDGHPLTARAAVAWSGDLPCRLQQVVFDTADAGWPLLTATSESSETRRLNLRRPARKGA